MRRKLIKRGRICNSITIAALLLIIVIITAIFIMHKTNKESFGAEEVSTQATETITGTDAYISSSTIIEQITGEGTFDSNDQPGNDSSAANNIIRSFDRITWTIENTMAMKSSSLLSNVKGGYINIEATLPSEYTGLVEWDIESMQWAENVELSTDKMTFKARYHMSEDKITSPGKQNLVLILKLYGIGNGKVIQPDFTLWLEGNTEEDYIKVSNVEEITVSAAPNYNINLVRNNQFANKVTVDYNDQEITGRMYGYGIILQLYNKSSTKGLKGIEYPTGDISFDISLKLERTLEGSTTTEDITELCTPLLWNYKINQTTYTGNIEGRTMRFGSGYSLYMYNAPLGIIHQDRTVCVYNSGNINMEQQSNYITTTISDYKFDGKFPKYVYNYEGAPHTSANYSANKGCFSVGYMQILVPFNEATLLEDRKYYLTVKDENFKATSISGTEVTSQMYTSDDSSRVQHVIKKVGTYNHAFQLMDLNDNFLSSVHSAGDGFAYTGQDIVLLVKFAMDVKNDDEIYTANKFVKFDGECVEPVLFDNGSKYEKLNFYGAMEFNVWYVTKKDGTNWTSASEMNNANIEDMLIYENIEDIPEGYICVGEYFESDDTYGAATRETGGNNITRIRLRVRNTAQIGKTYAFTGRTQYWLEPLDRSIYTITRQGEFEYPTPEWDSGNEQYIKAEYDENGKIISGTHYKNYYWGQSLLVAGSGLGITKESIDSENNIKTQYDIGKDEYDVKYRITPIIDNSEYSSSNVEDITLKVEETLPQGLTYVGGSAIETYGEPEIVENADGSTTLIWYLYDCSTEEIEPIEYLAHIDEKTGNGVQLKSTTIVSEIPEEIEMEDGTINKKYKVGNTVVSNRTTTNVIEIINLANHRLYKTTDTPVVERNDGIHYQITYNNNTSENVPEFQLLDILPYNGDGRGTSYNGQLILRNIAITQKDESSNQLSNDNLSIYISQSEEIKSANARNVDLEDTDVWEKVTETSGQYNIEKEVVAVAIKGEAIKYETLTVDMYLEPVDNQPDDVYANSAAAQISSSTEEIVTISGVKAEVVKRIIQGKIWDDADGDGTIGDNEIGIENIELELIQSDGSKAIDIYGNEISNVYTDSDGNYKFEDMARGNYKVVIKSSLTEDKEFTQKQVGANQEINSKFDKNGTTDEITKLNSIQNAGIIEDNVNAGIASKRGTITINKVDKLDNSILLEGARFKIQKVIYNEETQEYEIDTTFEAQEKETNENGQLSFEGLGIGTYKITETKAPSGYKRLEEDIEEITISRAYYDKTITIESKPHPTLPIAGGMGIYAILILGIGVIAIGLIIARNKKE